jgi:SAM-dependent methyltransferase
MSTTAQRWRELANWYDYPQYFDMVFRDETATEIDFFLAAFERFADGPVHRVLEPGCGSGRLVTALASRGFDVTGVDLSAASLNYLRRKLQRRKLSAALIKADFTRLELSQTFDAAYCTFNTFRHLTSESAAVSHLQSVADHLRPGGIYILGFHIIPLDAEKQCTERWKASHAQTTVNVTLRVTDFNRRKRLEQIHVVLTAKTATKTIRCRTDFPLRLYTAEQFRSTLHQVPALEVAAIYDFDYDLSAARVMDDDLIDSVFVLQKQ